MVRARLVLLLYFVTFFSVSVFIQGSTGQMYRTLAKYLPKSLRKNRVTLLFTCFAAILLPTHNKGKKHQRLLNLKKERDSSSRKSVYVRGFQNSGSIEEELTKYFNVYGKVSNIFLDKDKVNVSNTSFALTLIKTTMAWCLVLPVTL